MSVKLKRWLSGLGFELMWKVRLAVSSNCIVRQSGDDLQFVRPGKSKIDDGDVKVGSRDVVCVISVLAN